MAEVTIIIGDNLWADARKLFGGAAEAKRAIKQFLHEVVDNTDDRAAQEKSNVLRRTRQETRAARYAGEV